MANGADPPSWVIDVAVGVFGAITGALTVYAAVSSRLAVLERRADDTAANLGAHRDETKESFAELRDLLRAILASPLIDRRQIPRGDDR